MIKIWFFDQNIYHIYLSHIFNMKETKRFKKTNFRKKRNKLLQFYFLFETELIFEFPSRFPSGRNFSSKLLVSADSPQRQMIHFQKSNSFRAFDFIFSKTNEIYIQINFYVRHVFFIDVRNLWKIGDYFKK